jgi:serine phosphatase RsbU (regulator of sigma subunit)
MDLKTGELKYCNAGHNAPLIINGDGRVALLPVVPNLPLGMFENFPYEGQQTQVEKQTMIYLYTDGVNEAENTARELFGDLRIEALLRRKASLEPTDIVEATFEEVHKHANGAEQSDDITVMCIKYC